MNEEETFHTVRDVMTPYRRDTAGEETVLDVAKLMAKAGQAAVPVASADGHAQGILIATDIIASLAREEDPASTRAADITVGTVTLEADASLEEARDLLQENRGIAAVLDDGALVGVIELWELEKYDEAMRALGPCATRLITEISPQDRTAQRHRGGHLMAGVSAVECIKDAMAAADKDSVTSVLDFPSGHGRILRVLKAVFHDAELSAADIDHDGVDFCASVFGAVPIYSKESPEDIEINDTFDLIWSGSLLTHVNSDRWPGFLALFKETLSPDGLLVFTTHGDGHRTESILQRMALLDDQVQEVLRGYDGTGFGYVDYPRQQNYGISLTSPDWVRRQADAVGLKVVSYQEQGWYAPAPRHDVVACVAA